MMWQNVLKTVGVAACALLFIGCGASRIAYKPMVANAPAAAKAVALKVVDERPADKGGTEKTQVGQVRGSYGIPSSVKDSNNAVATQTVNDATLDALKQAGVGVKDGGSRILVATVKHFWMDGLAGYKATVKVAYSLQDGSGKELWAKEVSGGAGGALIFKSPESMATDMFGNALTDLAGKAATEFKSADFQKSI